MKLEEWLRNDLPGGSGPIAIPVREELLEHRVVSLTQRRLTDPAAVIASLPADQRPLPSVAGYDELLKHRTESSSVAVSKEQVS